MSSKLIACSKKKCAKEEAAFNASKRVLVTKNEQLSKQSNAAAKIKKNNESFQNGKANKSVNNCHALKCQDETRQAVKEYLAYVKQGCDAKSKAMCNLITSYEKVLKKSRISGDDKRDLEKKYLAALFS